MVDAEEAHWSPDGKKLAFLRKLPGGDSNRDDPLGLFVMRANGTGRKLVTRFMGIAFQGRQTFTWSPDGRRIAFAATHGTYVIRADGRNRVRIGNGDLPVWSPDSARLAMIRGGGQPANGGALWVVGANGKGARLVKAPNLSVGRLSPQSWSPNGKQLAVSCCGGEFAVVSVDQNAVRTYSFIHSWGPPSWAPNGKWIAIHGRDSDRGTWVLKPDGTGVRKLSRVGNGEAPIWSPDSRALAVEETCCITNVADIWTISVPEGTARRVTEGWRYEYFNLAPEWQPARLPTSKLPGRYVAGSIPSDVVATDSLLKTTKPIVQLVADGDAVAIGYARSCSMSDAWRPTPSTIIRFPRCGGSVALAGERVVWTYGPVVWGDGQRWFVHTSTFARPRATSPERQWRTGRPLGAPLGDGSLAVFSLWGPCNFTQGQCTRESNKPGELFRLDGERVIRIATSPTALTPISVDGGRILVDHEDGTFELLRRDGTLIRTFRLNAAVVRGVRLQGRDLVVLTTSAIEVTDAETGTFLGRWPLPAADARLEDVQDGVAVFVAGSEITLLRLRDGTSSVIEAPSSRNVLAQLEPSGLFYSYRVDDAQYPGRVAFIRIEELPLRQP